MFGLFSFAGFLAVAALWRREEGPNGHGLNARAKPAYIRRRWRME
jgi:hypothetical protein